MSTNTIKYAAALAIASMGMQGGAEVIHRPFNDAPAPHLGTSARRMGNNRPPGLTFAQKKRKRKIALASKRANRRRGS